MQLKPKILVKLLLPKLNFPDYTFRLQKTASGKHQVFDKVRKKFIDLTPEEWVRQHLIMLLSEEHGFPLSMFSVEKGLKLNNTLKRTDIVIYSVSHTPLLLVEAKADTIPLDDKVIQQSLRYNLTHKAPYVLISNGLQHFVFSVSEDGKPTILTRIPNYHELK